MREGTGEVFACLAVKLIELGLICEPHLENLGTHRADQIGADRPARVTGRVYAGAGLYFNVS